MINRTVESWAHTPAQTLPNGQNGIKTICQRLMGANQGRTHHGSRVDHGVMGQVFAVECNGVKILPAGFAAHVGVDGVFANVLQRNAIGHGFAGGLNAKPHIRIPNIKGLPIHRANADAQIFGVHSGQLGDITGHIASVDGQKILIDLGNVIRKS